MPISIEEAYLSIFSTTTYVCSVFLIVLTVLCTMTKLSVFSLCNFFGSKHKDFRLFMKEGDGSVIPPCKYSFSFVFLQKCLFHLAVNSLFFRNQHLFSLSQAHKSSYFYFFGTVNCASPFYIHPTVLLLNFYIGCTSKLINR